MSVTSSDLSTLRTGLEQGLAKLTECHVESQNEHLDGDQLEFERIYRFHEASTVRKRHLLVYFKDRWQYNVVCQGATEEDFAYWLPMFDFMRLTFRLSGSDATSQFTPSPHLNALQT